MELIKADLLKTKNPEPNLPQAHVKDLKMISLLQKWKWEVSKN